MHLKRLSLSGFRGVGSYLDLPLTRRTIIYGPNGSGKSSVLQSIVWSIYGKLPFLTGGVFTREDALVNDFLREAKAEVTLTLSDDVMLTRTREKKSSTTITQGTNILTATLEGSDPQVAVEQLVGLSLEEFFAAVFLHQETIRDFIISTPETRSAAIDRMLGTYLLRTLVRVVDPRVPAKAIQEAREAIQRVDQQLSQASLITREVIQIQERKRQYGDPAQLAQVLEEAHLALTSMAGELGVPISEPTISGLEESLDAVRQGQLGTVSDLNEQAGMLKTLRERYEHASVTGWQTVRERREQYGDPASLPASLKEIQQNLTPLAARLGVDIPEAAIADLEEGLAAARRSQPNIVGQFEKRIAQLDTLKERYEHAAVTGWQTVRERREQYGDPGELPSLLAEIRREFIPITTKLELATPQATITGLDMGLAAARRAQPSVVGRLEKQIGQLGTLRERYERISQEVIEDVSVPPVLEARRARIQARISTLNREIPDLNRQLRRRQGVEQELRDLRGQAQALPELRNEILQIREELETLEMASRRGTLYNQILAVGQGYLEEAEPEHCPLCKQKIADSQALVETLRQEIPQDVERMQQEGARLRAARDQKQGQAEQLEQEQRRIQELAEALGEYSEDLESQIESRQKESEELADELTTVQAEIIQVEGRIKLIAGTRNSLNAALQQIEEALGQSPGEDVVNALNQAIQTIRDEVVEIQALEFEPIAGRIDRAKQLDMIAQEEARLTQRLNEVLEEIEEALGQPPGEYVTCALDHAVQATGARASELQAFDFQPIARQLEQAKQLDAIQRDELRLHELESSYQTAKREKARLNYQIRRLTDLRDALQDIAETTKQRQQTIVTGVLSGLDIHRYYQQLDPHPAYRHLQIEPELTRRGTYNYWIKALTDDRSHGTYVQTRFSTAQANCAAIAIFLAVNQHLSKDLETIILDDPSQSMDPEHQKRLAQTLSAIPRQVIVATEDPQMFEFLADAFEAPTIHQLDAWTVDGACLA